MPGLTERQLDLLLANPTLADYFEDAMDGGTRIARRVAALEADTPASELTEGVEG